MRAVFRRSLAGLAAAGATLALSTTTAQAADVAQDQRGPSAVAACNSWSGVTGDGVRIRSHHSTSAGTNGLMYRGQRFCLDGHQSWPYQDGYSWAYGHSNTTGVSGWVATAFLSLP